MTRANKYPETATFHYYNNNPKARIGGDCVARGVALFLNITWEECVREMTECGLKHGLVFNDRKTIDLYLKEKGYEKMKQPRRRDDTKYTVKEFCEELATKNKRYLVSVASHVTVVLNNKVWDTWNCGWKSVGNYWERKEGAR